MMKHIQLLFAMILVLSGCSPKAVPTPQQAVQTIQAAAITQTTEDVFEVTAWVDNPSPEQGDRIMLSGSLIKNGTYLGGMMMTASWPDQDQELGVPNCKVLVIYARGICTIEVSNYPSGVAVPITVSFPYKGHYYTGTASFTPK